MPFGAVTMTEAVFASGSRCEMPRENGNGNGRVSFNAA